MCSSLHQLQRLTFIYPDNIGANAFLISKETIESVTSIYPRNKWSNCFADAMVAEMELKPWCHTTANEGFIEAVLGNTLMEPYDN
jgi:cyanamide hydratase